MAHNAKILKEPDSSALAKHALAKNLQFDYKEVKVLTYETDYDKRSVLERLHIKHDNKPINYQSYLK